MLKLCEMGKIDKKKKRHNGESEKESHKTIKIYEPKKEQMEKYAHLIVNETDWHNAMPPNRNNLIFQ